MNETQTLNTPCPFKIRDKVKYLGDMANEAIVTGYKPDGKIAIRYKDKTRLVVPVEHLVKA